MGIHSLENLNGALKSRKEGVLEGWGWYPDAHYNLILVYAGIWDRIWCERLEFWSIFPTV